MGGEREREKEMRAREGRVSEQDCGSAKEGAFPATGGWREGEHPQYIQIQHECRRKFSYRYSGGEGRRGRERETE
jgi:hypothetical protein